MLKTSGGNCKGPGPPPLLEEWECEEVARDFNGMMQWHAYEKRKRPYRGKIISFLADKYSVSERTIRRCIETHLPAIRTADREHKKYIFLKRKRF